MNRSVNVDSIAPENVRIRNSDDIGECYVCLFNVNCSINIGIRDMSNIMVISKPVNYVYKT